MSLKGREAQVMVSLRAVLKFRVLGCGLHLSEEAWMRQGDAGVHTTHAVHDAPPPSQPGCQGSTMNGALEAKQLPDGQD